MSNMKPLTSEYRHQIEGRCKFFYSTRTRMTDWRNAAINMLPDDCLLEIFLFLCEVKPRRDAWWRRLVQVCRRWRNLVFGLQRHLDLRLRCTDKTPPRAMLDVWPALPI